MIRDLGLLQSCLPSQVNTPPTGQVILFRDSSDGLLYQKNSLGIVSPALSYKTYKSLVKSDADTRTTGIIFVIGITYTIDTYVAGDDFSNIAQVVSGVINTTGCVFICTGNIAANYSNGSTITTDGVPLVTVLQNELGGNPVWSRLQAGSLKATLAGAFPVDKTFIQSSTNWNVYNGWSTNVGPEAPAGTPSDTDLVFNFYDNTGVGVDGIEGYIEIQVFT